MSDDTARRCALHCRKLDAPPQPALPLELGLARDDERRVFEAGQLVACRYHVERQLRSCAGAELYRVFDRELREAVALKAVRAACPSDPAVRALFSEARQTRLIRHPNVCRVHDVGVHQIPGSPTSRVYFSTLELIDGRRLSRAVSESALAPMATLGIGRQVLAGLEAAHQVGVQHRRLNASRVLLSGPTADPSARIIEFGLSELTELSSAEERRAGLALDLQAFGWLLLEMLTGRLPAACGEVSCGDPSACWRQLPPALAARIPPQLAEVVRRCVSPSPHDRFADARAVLHSLSS